MSSFQGRTIASFFKDLVQIPNSNGGADTTLRQLADGKGTLLPFWLSTTLARVDGGLGVGRSPSFPLDVSASGGTALQAVRVADSTPTQYFGIYNANTGANAPNAANATVTVRGMTGTSRALNAGGTVNASGADYAEYMVKSAGCGDIRKGDVCGVNADGQLTDRYDDSVAFVVKSTDPSYVGGDVWGRSVGPCPVKQPVRHDEEDDAAFNLRHDAWAAREDVCAWAAALEAARQTVDRIAFAGQVPCRVEGTFAAGDYVIPARADGGGIIAQAQTSPTLASYRRAVGQVWRVCPDRLPVISVKVA